MTVSMVFNDLSLRTPAPDRDTAREWMAGFVQTLKVARQHNLTTLRSHAHFKEMMLSPDYPMQAWFADRHVDKEHQRFVLSLSTRGAFIVPPTADLSQTDSLVERSQLFDAQYEGTQASGLGYALLFDGLSVSLLSETCWDLSSIELLCSEFSPEADGLLDSNEVIRHASRGEHIAQDHAQWIEDKLRSSVRDGNDLWSKAEDWFPNLIFCGKAPRQIQGLRSGNPQLTGIVERFRSLESYCRQWDSGGFDRRKLPPQYECSPESSQTLNQFRTQREYVCPDGETRLFDLHLKGLRGFWRIHIWPDEENRKILIGYVGPHLPTDTNPT